MAFWEFLGGKEAWYTITEATLKSVVTPVWETVSSTDNLKAASTAALDIVIANPLTATATIAIGVATYVVYKRKGFGTGLGQIDFNVDTFLAHFKLRTGLGRKKPTEVEDLDTRMSNMERGLSDARRNEEQHHNANLLAISRSQTAILDKLQNVTDTLESHAKKAKKNQETLVGNHTALLQQMGANQGALLLKMGTNHTALLKEIESNKSEFKKELQQVTSEVQKIRPTTV